MRHAEKKKDKPSGLGIKLGFVAAEFNSDVTDEMLKHALSRSAELQARITYVCRVPGAYDMPLIIQDLLKKDDVDAVVTLGAIVTGETKHDEVIADVIANKAAGLALRYGKPVALGVSGPAMTLDQAMARAEDFATRSVDAAVKLARRHGEIVKKRRNVKYPVVIG